MEPGGMERRRRRRWRRWRGGLQRDAQRRNLGRGSGGPNPLVLERWKGRVVWDLFISRGRLSCRFGIFFSHPPSSLRRFPPSLRSPPAAKTAGWEWSLFIYLFISSSIYSLIYLFSHLFILLLIEQFVELFIYPLIYSHFNQPLE